MRDLSRVDEAARLLLINGDAFDLRGDEWNARMILDGFENCLKACDETANGLFATNDMTSIATVDVLLTEG